MSYYTNNHATWTARTPEQRENEQREIMWAAMMRNDDVNRENINLHLEESLRCARQGNWWGMDHCFRLYAQQEVNRLGARLRIMEEYAIETYHENPYTHREHALLGELFDLLRAFLSEADAIGERLYDAFLQHPDGPHQSTLNQFKRMANMCAERFISISKPKAENQVAA